MTGNLYTMNVMNKITTILCAVVLAVVGATTTSCEKLENADFHRNNSDGSVIYTVTVNLPSGSKALGEFGNILCKTFAANEQIKLTYGSNTVLSEPLDGSKLSNGNQSATFEFRFTTTPNLPKDTHITYEYPAAHTGLSGQDGTLTTLERTFDYAKWEGSVVNEGELPTPDAPLANQYAIGKFTIKNSSGEDISNTLTQLTISDGTNTYTIVLQSVHDLYGPIWVAMNPVNDKAITFTATDGTNTYHKTTGSSQMLLAGKLYIINVTMIKVEGALPGRFTISNDGGTTTSQVFFSKGNLQAAFASAGSSRTWQFATNQWDYIGSAAANTSINGSGSVSVAGTVDLFGWVGTSSSNNNYGIWNNTTTNDYGNTKNESLKNDWGHNEITNGGNTADMWRTLTREEWGYMLSTRSGATVNGSNNVRFAKATIRTDATGVKGLLLFPDGATFDASEASWGVLNDGYNNYTTTCTAAQWTALEAKGCVFLPAAGNRTGTTVSDAGNAGAYWTATGSDSKNSDIYPYSYRVYFGQTSWGNPQYYSQQQKSYGHSVRLVREVN